MPRKSFRVWHSTGMSDDAGTAYFAVSGPHVNEFEFSANLARIMQEALNGPAPLSARDRRIIRSALAAALASPWGEGDLRWRSRDAAAAEELIGRLK